MFESSLHSYSGSALNNFSNTLKYSTANHEGMAADVNAVFCGFGQSRVITHSV